MKWEYKTVNVDATGLLGPKVKEKTLDARLNEWSERGWELVEALIASRLLTTSDVVLIFKRPASQG